MDYFICEDSLYNPGGGTAVMGIYNENDILFVLGDGVKRGGTTILNRAIGKWDNNNWQDMAGTINASGSGGGKCLTYFNGFYYMGGSFAYIGTDINAAYFVYWDGDSWEGVPNSYGVMTQTVFDMTIYNNMLVIGGRFHSIGTADPLNFYCIAAYDGTDYINMGTMPETVFALETYNGELYAGGAWFTLRKYTGAGTGYDVWEDVGGYLNYYVKDMEVDTFNNFLLVAGGFTMVDDSIPCDYGIWDGFRWSGVGTGEGYALDANAICLYNGDVYLGGNWDTIGGQGVGYCAFFDGEQWQRVNSGIYTRVNALEVFRDTLFIGQDWLPTQGDTLRGTLARYYALYDGNCRYMRPRVQSITDTFYMYSGEAEVQLYNNNAYVDSWEWDFGDSGTSNVKDPTHIYTATGDYNVHVTVTDGACIKTASKIIHVLLGDEIPEIENIHFKIYPNPSDGVVYVEVGDSQGATSASQGATQSRTLTKNSGLTLRITGLNGHTKTTVPVTAEKTAINTNGWEKGTYLVNLFVDGKLVRTEKLVVE